MGIDEIVNRLVSGNQRFVSDSLHHELQDKSRRDTLVKGQQPWAIVLSCADSRVVPELIFDTGIGELFVVRVAGNVSNTSSIASIEYAVAHLNSKVIIVLGHESCGAVVAAMKGGDNGYNLNHLLTHINPSIVASGESKDVNEVVKQNAIVHANGLVNRSGIIKQHVDEKKVKIAPAYYSLISGKVDFL